MFTMLLTLMVAAHAGLVPNVLPRSTVEGALPPAFGSYSLLKEVALNPHPFLPAQMQDCDDLCADKDLVYYSAGGYLLHDVFCEEAYLQHNKYLNGDACLLNVPINNEEENLWDACPLTMHKFCELSDDFVESKSLAAPGIDPFEVVY